MELTDQIIEVMDPCEPYTASEIADEIGSTRRTVDRRLRELADDEAVNRKKHSKRRVSWWIEEE